MSPSANPLAIALDVGGTSVKSGIVLSDGTVSHFEVTTIDASAEADTLVDELTAIIGRAVAGAQRNKPLPLSLAFPGPFDYPAGIPLLDHKFGSLKGLKLGDLLSLKTQNLAGGVSTIGFVNDAEAAGAAEVCNYAAAGGDAKRVLVLTLGTGLGAAMFDTAMFNGARSDRAQAVAVAGGLAVSELWRYQTKHDMTADEAFSASGLANRLGIDHRLLAKTLTAAGSNTDESNSETIRHVYRWAADFGRFLELRILPKLEAEVIILSGGLSEGLAIFGSTLQDSVGVPIVSAQLGRPGPLVGAIRLAFPKLLADRY